METAMMELIKWMEDFSGIVDGRIAEKAISLLEAEKKQIVDAFQEGDSNGFYGKDKNGSDYYNTTYQSK